MITIGIDPGASGALTMIDDTRAGTITQGVASNDKRLKQKLKRRDDMKTNQTESFTKNEFPDNAIQGKIKYPICRKPLLSPRWEAKYVS